MDITTAPTEVTGMAVMAWTWATAFAPRLLAAAVIIVCGLLFSHWLRRGIVEVTDRSRRIDPTLRPVLLAVVRYGIFILVLLLVLNQLGIQTTSLLAILGAAGIAIGLALQGTLSNIAAGIMLLWLRPFKLGDYIEVNGQAGVVEETGLFVCILRTYDGARLFAPNSTIWNYALRNHTRVDRRMLAVSITVAGEGRERTADALKAVMQDDPAILRQPAPVIFLDQLTDSGVTLTCRFWTAHHHYGAMQRSIGDILHRRLIEAGIAPTDLKLIARVTPPPADPTRLIDL